MCCGALTVQFISEVRQENITKKCDDPILDVTVTCDSDGECQPSCNLNVTFTFEFLKKDCWSIFIFDHVTASPFQTDYLLSVEPPLWIKTSRRSCVHTLWFCKDTTQIADGESHVWLGLVLQCCLLSGFIVALDLSHRTPALFVRCFLIIAARVNVWKMQELCV